MRKQTKNLIYDRLHKGSVIVCLAMSLYGASILAQFTYRHFKYVRPQIEAAKVAAERELLAEGSSDKIL